MNSQPNFNLLRWWPVAYWLVSLAVVTPYLLKDLSYGLPPVTAVFLTVMGPLVLFALPLFFVIGTVSQLTRLKGKFLQQKVSWLWLGLAVASISFSVWLITALVRSGL